MHVTGPLTTPSRIRQHLVGLAVRGWGVTCPVLAMDAAQLSMPPTLTHLLGTLIVDPIRTQVKSCMKLAKLVWPPRECPVVHHCVPGLMHDRLLYSLPRS